MSTFITVNDEMVSLRIGAASSRVVFVAPAVSSVIAEALGGCFRKAGSISVTVVLDPDEDAYRLGYGERAGLEKLQQLARDNHMALRSQPGLRIGLLLVDDDVLVWSPTPRAVEGQRTADEPNGVDLGSGISQTSSSAPLSTHAPKLRDGTESFESKGSLVDLIQNAVGADDSNVLPGQAEIGRGPLTPERMAETVKTLKENPPAPFDLAAKTRVFSTKFQFVEFELRGAEWTKREIKLSSLLLNPDVPDELQDLFETRIRPFSQQVDVAVEVPALVQGQFAYNREGQAIHAPMTQADIEKSWKDLRERYLRRLPGFGWLIPRSEKARFEADVTTFVTVLKAWVVGFTKDVANDEQALVKRIVDFISARAERPIAKVRLKGIDIEATVRAGIQRLRITEPSVKLIFKEISWESTRDDEFTEALRKALPAEQLKGWFEVFTAARQRSTRQSAT